MTVVARILGESPVELWGLKSPLRLRRQLQSIGVQVVTDTDSVTEQDRVLLVRADYLFETRTLKALLEHSDAVLLFPGNQAAVAAIVDGARLAQVEQVLAGQESDLPAGLRGIDARELYAFDVNLRRAETPLLEPLLMQKRSLLEDQLYGNAYKGITDLVTKWLWPRPAKRIVRLCARHDITPNVVTATGFLLVLLAGFLFYRGDYWLGLAAGWVMTLLDTVDGKLARVTVQSSRFGHYFDHGIDLIHPPFWYIYWGMSLPELALDGLVSEWFLYWSIIIGYIGGRLVEAAFHLFADCSIFTWRPFDAWFRLVTARRNPCLVVMSICLLMQRPDWALVGVAAWTVLTSVILLLRLLQAGVLRLIRGRLSSWLAEPGAGRTYPRSYRTFAATAGAYAPG